MTLSEFYHKDVPAYYDWMYLDGYTPEQIMYAKHRQMHRVFIERKSAEQLDQQVVIPKITFKSEVRVK